jgi:hypothetical protein
MALTGATWFCIVLENMEDRSMGKSTKRSRRRHKRSGKTQPTIGRRRFLLGSTSIVATSLAAGVGIYYFTRRSNQQAQAKPFGPDDLAKLPRFEKRPTLSPSLFNGRVADAYAIAKLTPALLDQLYCYCRCKENFGHKSLLSCYVDRHAST